MDVDIGSTECGVECGAPGVIRALLKMIDAENKFWGLKVMD